MSDQDTIEAPPLPAESPARTGAPAPALSRRRFLQLGLLAGGGYLAARGAYFALWEGQDLRVTEWEVPLPRLPADLDGLRLALLADVHLGSGMPPEYLDSAIRLAGRLPADAVCFAGDILSGDPPVLERYAEALAAPGPPRGKYAVLGNHDYYYHRHEPTAAALAAGGWRMLRNDSTPLPGTGGRLWIAGLDDAVTSRDDLSRTLSRVPSDAVCVLLSHTPDVVFRAAERGVDLQLSGHTHGGQVVLPFFGPPAVPSHFGARFAWGLFNCQGTRLVVTRGVGMTRPLVRFNCPPELVLLTLRRGDWPLSSGGAERDLRPLIRRARSHLRRVRRIVTHRGA